MGNVTDYGLQRSRLLMPRHKQHLVLFLAASLVMLGVSLTNGRHALADPENEHITTFVKLPGDFATTHAAPWDLLSRYIDYLDVDQRGSEEARNAGIRVGFYTDIHLLCKGTSCSGSPNVDEVPDSAFAHTCSGERIYTSDDTASVQKLLGDPRSPELTRVLNRVIDHKLRNEFGNFHEDFVIDDDVFIPQAPWFTWHAGSPHGAQLSQPHCGYSTPAYIAAIKKIENQAHLPVIFNGLNGPANVPYIENAPNVLGGICEDCLHTSYDPSRNREPSPTWNQELDAALAATRLKKLWIDYPHGEIDNDTQGYIYASLMLVYHGRWIALDEDISPPSGVPLPATIELVPHAAIQATPIHIDDLRRPTGVYAREFKRCTIAGTSAGPCAAVVNPDAHAAHRWPFPAQRYQHRLRILGNGVARELGDTGRLMTDGDTPPAWVGARGWAIGFR